MFITYHHQTNAKGIFYDRGHVIFTPPPHTHARTHATHAHTHTHTQTYTQTADIKSVEYAFLGTERGKKTRPTDNAWHM